MIGKVKKVLISAVLVFSVIAFVATSPKSIYYAEGDWETDSESENINTDIAVSKVSGGELPSQQGIDEDTPDYDYADYKTIEENENMILYADMNNGYFALKSKISGKIWYSVPNDMLTDEVTTGSKRSEIFSQIVLEYIYTENQYEISGTQSADSYSYCVQEDNVSVKEISKGIKVTYSYESLGIVIPVEYTLADECLNVKIINDEIQCEDTCIIMGINVLPSFGAGNWNEGGWMFVPDGCGAIVNFNNQINTLEKYNKYVYGDELAIIGETHSGSSQDIRMPVFATNSGNDALIGIITKGESAASITYFNGNDNCGYNCISSTVNYRNFSERINIIKNKISSKISNAEYSLPTYEVSYYITSGEESNISGIAQVYRKFLEDEKKLESTVSKPSLNLNIYGFIETKSSFLGIPYTKKTILTTASQTKKILEYLYDNNIENIGLKYIGWGNSGVDNKNIPITAKPSAKIGGNKDFSDLYNIIINNGGTFYPDVDLIKYTSSGNGVNKSRDSIKSPFQTISTMSKYLSSNFEVNSRAPSFYILTPQKINEIAEPFVNSYKKLDIDTISLSSIANYSYSNFDKKNAFNRSGIIDVYTDALEKFSNAGIKTAFSDANAYAIPYAERIFETPIYSSNFDSFNYDVPFYQMVIHGMVSMTSPAIIQSSNPTTTYLKSIEYGLELLYNGIYNNSEKLMGTGYDCLYSANYKLWIDDAILKYNGYSDLLNLVYNKKIVSNTEVSNNVKKTVYENNVVVYVNYNDEQVTVDGMLLNPESFAYKEVN